MEFKKIMSGWYKNAAGTVEIKKYGDMWEVYAISKYEKDQYIGFAYTLKEAKEIASKV